MSTNSNSESEEGMTPEEKMRMENELNKIKLQAEFGADFHINEDLPAEVENDFKTDLSKFSNVINRYKFETTDIIADRFNAAGLINNKEIKVQLDYTNGMDYFNRSEFYIKAPVAGSFTINYSPGFQMADKGYINFTVESTDKALEIIEDFSLDRNAKAGSITIKLPSAGNYKLTVCSKYKS